MNKINPITRIQPGTLKDRSLSYNFHCKQCHTEKPINGRKYVPKVGMSGKWWICSDCAALTTQQPVDSQIDFTAEIARLVKLNDALRANERRLIDDLESALASATQSPSECRHCGFMVKLNETPISSSDLNVEANVALLRDRAAVGFKKYSVTTERTDLSQEDWIQHTIEELLDAANYLQAMKNNPAKGK